MPENRRRGGTPDELVCWRSGLWITTIAIVATACAHVRPVARPLEPVGLTCGVSNVRAPRKADTVFASARAALIAMHVTPTADSATRHLLVSGEGAPHGQGTSQMQDARIYLDFRVAPVSGDSTASTYSVAPGLSIEPRGISVDEAWALYRQADEFAAKFMARAGLPWGSCFGVKGTAN